MAAWQSAQLGAKLFPLLRGELVVDRVRLKGADLRLVRRADGHGNWEGIGSNEPPPPPGQKARQITVDGVEIEDSRLLFVDEVPPGRRVEITALHLVTDEIAPDEPFTDTEIAGVLHMDGFAPAGVPFKLGRAARRADPGLLEPRDPRILTWPSVASEARGRRERQLWPAGEHSAERSPPTASTCARCSPPWASRRQKPRIPRRSRECRSTRPGSSTAARSRSTR